MVFKFKKQKKGNVRDRRGMERICLSSCRARLSKKYSGRFGMSDEKQNDYGDWDLLR